MISYGKILTEQIQKIGTIRTAVFLDGSSWGERLLWTDKQILWCKPEMTPKWTGLLDLLNETDAGRISDAEGSSVFVEQLSTVPELVILGGGHISLPVSQIGKILGFRVTVVDDRPEFAVSERFESADRIICAEYEEAFAQIPENANTYYVVVTPGHKKDRLCAELLFKRKFAYFGMIGSRNKVAKTREGLRLKGITEEQLDTMHAPIGIPLGGETPAEIAVSICAEIVQVKNQNKSSELPEILAEAISSAAEPLILVTIAEKTGSSPRGTGSRMLVYPDGHICGTVGGGAVEFAAIEKSQRMLTQADDFAVERYDLSDSAAATLGMICGGKVCVIFERI